MDYYNFGSNPLEKHKVAIVSSKDTFSVMGIKKKLQEEGYDGISVRPSVFQIEQAVEEKDPIIFYMDDDIYTARGEGFLRELKSLCLEDERFVILVGAEQEYEHAIQFIPKSAIVEWFSRPIDMDALLAAVQSAINGEIAPARIRHVLVIDDDPTYLRMLHQWMKELYQVTMLDSGAKAIHWLMENGKVDLILLDYEMPSMDGPTVFHMLKEDPNTRDIPVMFLTGKNQRDKVVKAVDMRPEEYILKGLGKRMLMDKLEEFFRKNRMAQAPLSQE